MLQSSDQCAMMIKYFLFVSLNTLVVLVDQKAAFPRNDFVSKSVLYFDHFSIGISQHPEAKNGPVWHVLSMVPLSLFFRMPSRAVYMLSRSSTT